MAQEEGNKDITLDDLLKVVELAARTIERLNADNATLAQRIRDYEAAAQAAAAEAEARSRQIEELEKSEAALREDAEWCRWFKNRYGASTFFSHIEREYQSTRRPQEAAEDRLPPAPESGIAPDAS